MQNEEVVLRTVSEHGETLIVRIVRGCKALVDPCDHFTVVHVPLGRRARLTHFNFGGLLHTCGRDALTYVFTSDGRLGFESVYRSCLRVLLQDLPEGQQVDVLPASEPAAAYAAVRRPLPVLYGAAAAVPAYAAVAA